MNERREHENGRALVVGLFVLLGMFVMICGPGLMNARASTANVTVTWVIPTDKTISISYPTGQTAVQFSPSSPTFAQLKADSQVDATAGFRVTNNGNVAVQLDAVFTAHMLTGIAEFDVATASSSNAPSGTQFHYCGDTSDTGQSPAGSCSGTQTDLTSQTIKASLAVAGTVDYWCWSWGTNVGAGTSSKTFQVTSS